MKKAIPTHLLYGLINSYSQVFFTKSIYLSAIVFFISFIDRNVGFCGLLAIVFTLITAELLGYSKTSISAGSYGFNSLLVGLGIGVYFDLNFPLVLLIFFAAVSCLFITIAIEGVFIKYGLPFLSLPFIITLIGINFAAKNFTNLGFNESWLFESNELYKLGGIYLTKLNELVNTNLTSLPLKIYFYSLGAIVFQVNILAGIAISIGLLIYSRIFFILSLIGFYTAFYFYKIMGADIENLAYSYIGFNFILTAIALAGFYTVPNLRSILWTIVILPLVAMTTMASYQVFIVFGAPIYAIPFNVVVLLAVYVFKLRIDKNLGPEFPIYQYFNPEENLYYHRNFKKRFPNKTLYSMYLPFWGTWTINQAFNGKYTHKDQWKYAWDFVITDEEGKEYKNSGLALSDYYCYDKPVLAPASGYVIKVIDHIPENEIGKVNLMQNWGNTVIINHGSYFYTQISHLKPGSITVHEGSYIAKGQQLGTCGNSGRSPYPHIHFQAQSSPEQGAATIKYPFSHYINNTQNRSFESYDYPKLDSRVANVDVMPILEHGLNMTPGQKLHFKSDNIDEFVTVEIDVYNNRYLSSSKYNSKAYFTANEVQFNFTVFKGSKDSVIFLIFKALYRVQFGFYKDIEIKDEFSIYSLFSRYKLVLHDFIAPIGSLVSSKFNLKYISIDHPTSPKKVLFKSSCISKIFNFTLNSNKFIIEINRYGIHQLISSENGKISKIICTIE